jgi:hypothetical protein
MILPQHLKPLRKEETMSKEANSQLAIRQKVYQRFALSV